MVLDVREACCFSDAREAGIVLFPCNMFWNQDLILREALGSIIQRTRLLTHFQRVLMCCRIVETEICLVSLAWIFEFILKPGLVRRGVFPTLSSHFRCLR